jgi:amino acid transporter
MQNLGVTGLPHLVNALLITSIFSAGNSYVYCASRSLYSLALEGRAPGVLKYCTKSGVPLYSFIVVMIFPCLAFLQLSNDANQVLTWLINLVTAGGVINYIVITITFIFFYRACQVQGLERQTLPYTGWFQPYSAYIGLGWMIFIVFTYGYSSFSPFDVTSFFTYYAMLILAPILFVTWKLIKRTRFVPASKADLIWERPIVEAYEATFIDPPSSFWTEMLQLIGLRRGKGLDRRTGSIAE